MSTGRIVILSGAVFLLGFLCFCSEDKSGRLDDIAPTLSITYPAMNDSVSGVVTIRAQATDNVGVRRLEFFIDGQIRHTDQVMPWVYDWDCTELEDSSSHTISGKAYDVAGNQGTADEITVIVLLNPVDWTPPAAITDLWAGDATANSVTLHWTAPGDDSISNTASYYDIRYSTSEITEADFDDADTVTDKPSPSPAGTEETCVVSGLDAEVTYYFAIKTADEVPNRSGISNIASATTVNTWQKTFGGSYDDIGYAVVPAADGGFVITGLKCPTAQEQADVYLFKTDVSGNTVWEKTFSNTALQTGFALAPTTDGGYIIAGDQYSATIIDVYLIKTNAAGEVAWEKTYGGSDWDRAYAVTPTADGGYILAGETKSLGAGDYDVYLIKTDESGNLIWEKTFGGIGRDGGSAVIHTADGGCMVAGWTNSSGAGNYDVYLIRTDADGDSLWTRTFGGAEDDLGYAIAPTANGGFIIAGGTETTSPDIYDIYLIEIDQSGDALWTKTFGGSASDIGFAVTPTPDGGYVVAGVTGSVGFGGYDAYLIKTDATGNLIWEQTFGGAGDEEARSVAATADEGYIVTGRTMSFGAGGSDVYLIKTNRDGEAAEMILTRPPNAKKNMFFEFDQLGRPGRPIPR